MLVLIMLALIVQRLKSSMHCLVFFSLILFTNTFHDMVEKM